MRPKGMWSSSGTQNMQPSMGQYSMQAGEPAQPVQQSVVMARMRGLFLRVALPSPTDIGQCFSTISIMLSLSAPGGKSLEGGDTLACLKRALKVLIRAASGAGSGVRRRGPWRLDKGTRGD